MKSFEQPMPRGARHLSHVVLVMLVAALSGCAGLTTSWVLQMHYSTPEEKTPAPVLGLTRNSVPLSKIGSPAGRRRL